MTNKIKTVGPMRPSVFFVVCCESCNRCSTVIHSDPMRNNAICPFCSRAAVSTCCPTTVSVDRARSCRRHVFGRNDAVGRRPFLCRGMGCLHLKRGVMHQGTPLCIRRYGNGACTFERESAREGRRVWGYRFSSIAAQECEDAPAPCWRNRR